MIIRPEEQGTLGWIMARTGIPTASEFDSLVTPEWKIRTGETPKTYLAKKVAEAWSGTPLPGWNTIDMDFGKILEDEALPFYTLETGAEIKRVGLITTDDGAIGCSPDGMLEDGTGIEVKCPEMHTHVKYLLAGVLPKDYAAQVHGAMFVTGADHWTFMSYCRRFPALILRVERDDEAQAAIGAALDQFKASMAEALSKLEALNGGPPRRSRPEFIEPKAEYKPSDTDITP
jgi:hypothetical protein